MGSGLNAQGRRAAHRQRQANLIGGAQEMAAGSGAGVAREGPVARVGVGGVQRKSQLTALPAAAQAGPGVDGGDVPCATRRRFAGHRAVGIDDADGVARRTGIGHPPLEVVGVGGERRSRQGQPRPRRVDGVVVRPVGEVGWNPCEAGPGSTQCIESIGYRGEGLAGRENGVGPNTATGTNSDLQPAGVASEDVAPKVQCHREQAVGHRHVFLSDGAAHLAAAIGGVVQLELEVVAAVGGATAVGQAALVGEHRAHRSQRSELSLLDWRASRGRAGGQEQGQGNHDRHYRRYPFDLHFSPSFCFVGDHLTNFESLFG